MSSPPIPEARIVFKATGGIMSSREMQNVAQIIGREVMYESKPRYPPRREGGTVFYDFECVSFNVTERNGVLTVSVNEDRTNQDKRLVVGGVVVAEGEDLGFRMFQVHGRLSAKGVVASPSKVKPVEGKFNVLSIVDIYGWAWDIASKELFASLPSNYAGQTISTNDFSASNVDASRFDVVLCYPYMYMPVVGKLGEANTILCVAGWGRLEEKVRMRELARFKYWGACNERIAEVIRGLRPDAHVFTLSHGVDLEKFKPNQVPHGGFRVGWAGDASRPIKRFWVAEAAVGKVGGAELAVAGLVQTPKHVPRDDMPKFYNELDCLLVTSSTEAHSMVTYEAAASGLPIVTTDVGDVLENFTDGVDAFILASYCTVDQVAEKLRVLRDDPELRAGMGAAARRMVEDRWRWGRVAETYVDAFREVMGIHHRSRRRVGFLWWRNFYPEKGEHSVLTIQREALRRMGVDVETFDIATVFDGEEELRRLNDVDLVFTSVTPLVLEDERYGLIKSPVLFQLDGYGDTSFHGDYVNPLLPKLTEKADLVTFLDMNVYEEFARSGLKFDYGKILFVPNGCEDLSRAVTSPEFRRSDDELIVGSLMKENMFKEPWHLLEAFKAVRKARPSIRMLYPLLDLEVFRRDFRELGWPPGYAQVEGVDYAQHVPYGKIPSFIASCDVFAHYSSGDAFAKTVTEAFSLGKAPIVSDIVRVQGVEAGGLVKVKEVIGEPMPSSYEAMKPSFHSGHMKHLYVVPRRSPSLCAEALLWAVDHPWEYGEMGAEAKRWSDEWITWSRKWEHIFSLAEEKKIL